MCSDVRKACFSLGLIVMFLLASVGIGAAHGTEPGADFGLKLVDAALVRPAAMLGASVSTALFVGSLPISFFIGVGTDACDVLVVAPWRFTAVRYLGDFNSYTDSRSITGRLKAY
jgi:hypothetical protein